MTFNTPEILPYLDKETVRLCILYEVELKSGTLRFAMQTLDLVDNNGVTWAAAEAGVISFSDFPLAASAAAQKRSYTIALGELSLGNSFAMQEDEFRGRKLTQYMQIFAEDWTPLGVPVFLHTGIMDIFTPSINGDGQAVGTLDCESLFAVKNRSPFALLTDTDQRARYPDDAGLDEVKLIERGIVLDYPPSG